MTDWLLSVEGTPEAARIALGLALLAAFMHAVFGAIQKGRHDPWLTRGAIDFCYGMIAAPFALFLVPWPESHMWPIFAGMYVIHVIYKLMQGRSYALGAYTVVYPVVRGLGPLFTVLAVSVVFQERFSWVQWAGIGLLSAAILTLAMVNVAAETVDRRTLKHALGYAVAAGAMVAAYTTYDAYGIRATADPFTFLAWFFFIDGLFFFPWLALWRYRRMDAPPEPVRLMLRGLIGALVAFVSFGSIMLATRLDSVGEAAVLRETSTVFAALIGWIFLKDHVGLSRAALMVLIALGAVLVELGSGIG